MEFLDNLEPLIKYSILAALAFHALIFGVWIIYLIKSFTNKTNPIDEVLKEAL